MSYDCYCDYDPPEFCAHRMVKARKQFRCEECGHRIQPGQLYERTSGKWDGYFCTFVTCRHCAGLREWARISVPCFCWTYGNVLEDIRDMVAQVRRDVPGFFFEYGRRVIAAKRAKAAEGSLP